MPKASTLLRWLAMLLGAWFLYWCGDQFLVSEATQVSRAQRRFVEALEERKWAKVEALIRDDYKDEWGQDHKMVLQTMREILGPFIMLAITPSESVVREGGVAEERLVVEGTGAGFSSTVVAESKKIKAPWKFYWTKNGRWPWSWAITKIGNDELADYKLPER